MNTLSGKIVDIYLDGGSARARVHVDGTYMHVPLLLLMEARVGDRILIESGMAVARVKNEATSEV